MVTYGMIKHMSWSIVLLFVLIAVAAVTLLWWKGAFLPGWVKWHNEDISTDDGMRITLKGRKTICTVDGVEIWRAESGWYVQNVLFFDINRDGKNEIVLICWKHGSYGKHKPTWVERDTIAFSQHIFIFRTQEDGAKPVWMSSALDLQIADGTYDDRNCLILEAPDGECTTWSWSDWGLERLK